MSETAGQNRNTRQASEAGSDEIILLSGIIFGPDDLPDFQVCTIKSHAPLEVKEWAVKQLHRRDFLKILDFSQRLNTAEITSTVNELLIDADPRERFFETEDEAEEFFIPRRIFANSIIETPIPISRSPISGQDLKTIAASAAPGGMMFLGSISQGVRVEIAIFYSAGSIIIMGVAQAIAEALKAGLFRKFMKLLGELPDAPTSPEK